ncbi:MAG: sulfurtransferase-like selenium metabolism protein YedF [Candidatus Riflebacteria bacterium]|nr:sulfurtransferase-like selenium metabolism protein YedF [Candidatus Riflebacteria bacterium]
MSEKTVDARGMLCPKPLIMTKKALAELPVGETLTILVDNATARENVTRFLQDNAANPTSSEDKGVFTLIARKSEPHLASPRAEAYCRPESGTKPFVMVFNHAGMGFGSEELGKILIQACINAVKEVAPLPSTMLFFNGGVHMVCEPSPVLQPLTELESRGVKILVCGTCLDYYELKPKLKVGRISNMYDILQTIATAGSVFTP